MPPLFTYEVPEPNNFLANCIEYLNYTDKKDLGILLLNSSISFVDTGQFSSRQWDEIIIIAYLSVPKENIKQFTSEVIEQLTDAFNTILPKNSGFLIGSIEVSIDFSGNKKLEDDLIKKIQEASDSQLVCLPPDLFEKGKQMAEFYTYFYIIENSLRLFIEKVATDKYGSDYCSQLVFTKGVKDKIESRKKQEEKNLWIPIRGGTDLYYTDFIELSSIIQSNWDMFKTHFPSSEFITSKIQELYALRNMVAHFSYLTEDEKQIIIAYYSVIMKQINGR